MLRHTSQELCACTTQELGQRALVSYMRSLFLQPNRAVFGDVAALPAAGLALSLGLSSAPQLRFLKRARTLALLPYILA